MKDQIITDTVAMIVNYQLGAAKVANVFHAQYSSAPGDAELDALEAAIEAWLTTEWAPIASDEWGAVSATLTDYGSLTGLRKNYAIAPTIQGTRVTEALPPNVTFAIRASIGHRGRGKQGRVFFVGLGENQVDNYVVASASVTDMISAMEDLNTRVKAVVPFLGLCVPHLVVGGTPQNPATSELVTQFLATDNVIDSQRDRLPFHNRKRKKKTTPAP